jgi:small subunit ribosomal protein S18
MPRGGDRDRSKRSPKDAGRRTKKKVCIFCKDKIDWVDYKDVNLLRKFMSDRGKIRARRVSGNCAQHQRDVAVAIKTARELALLPYSQRTMTERSGGRGGRGAPRPVVPRSEPQVGATAGPPGRPDGAGGAPTAPPPTAPAPAAGAADSKPERPATPVGADARGGGDP